MEDSQIQNLFVQLLEGRKELQLAQLSLTGNIDRLTERMDASTERMDRLGDNVDRLVDVVVLNRSNIQRLRVYY